MNKVFVYGTLRDQGRGATHYLDNYAMYDAGPYPYILPANGYTVSGNIVEVSDEVLADLDKYEGIDRGLYTRELLDVEPSDDNDPLKAYVYVAGKSWPRLVENGDWFSRE